MSSACAMARVRVCACVCVHVCINPWLSTDMSAILVVILCGGCRLMALSPADSSGCDRLDR